MPTPAAPVRRLPAAALTVLLAALLLLGCSTEASEGPVRGSPVPATSATVTVAPARPLPAADLLRRWDRARAEAFAAGDPAALRRLYVPGSAAGTTDVRMLRAYLRRGLRVEGMRMQLLAVDVVERQPARIRLRVTDRLADGALAVGPGSRVPLPADAASTRAIELVRRGGDVWQVRSVRETAPPRAAR